MFQKPNFEILDYDKQDFKIRAFEILAIDYVIFKYGLMNPTGIYMSVKVRYTTHQHYTFLHYIMTLIIMTLSGA